MDTMARAVAQQMQTRLGQPVVVENRPGAGTTIGAKAVVNAEPDGLTLLWGTLSMVAIAPVLYKDLDFDPKALVPVALVAEFPSVMVIPPSLPANTMAEFIAYAKANRGKLNYGGSLGTPPQLMGAMFNKVADLGMTYVPYRGGAPSIPDLIAGRLHMQFDALTLLRAAGQGRQAARARRSDAAALARPARRSDLARGGLRRFPGQCLGRASWRRPTRRKPIISKLNATINDILRSPEAKAEPRQAQRPAAAGLARGVRRLRRQGDAGVGADGAGIRRDGAVSRRAFAGHRIEPGMQSCKPSWQFFAKD